jgi:serine/threonine-protein kinase HipA
MSTGLLVRLDEAVVGRLWLDGKRHFCFQYDDGWLQRSRIPLSLSLPLRQEPYLDDESHAFFANLLPEERLRSLVARNLGISPTNDYGLLERIGGDCAGAVSLFSEDAQTPDQTGAYRQLSLDELNHLIGELPRRPLLAGEAGIRISLAGAQKKLPLFHDGQHFHLGLGSAPSNIIIKPPIDGLDNTVENEAFCMALAHGVGLDVPASFIHQHCASRAFVIHRYDRVIAGSTIRRLHQEDFCQALRIPPEFKYEAEGGPALAACFELVRTASIAAGRDVLSLVNWVIFNYLLGNSDAHGKNLSLLLLPEGPRLAPFYDLLSTRIYTHYGLAADLAMKIGEESNPDAVRKKHWLQFAEEVGIKPALVLARIKLLTKKIPETSRQLYQGSFAGLRCDALGRLMELIGEQAEKLARRIA